MNTASPQNTLRPDLWIKLYRRQMVYYAYRRVGDLISAQDLVQDAFVSALSGVDRYQGRANEKTWLYSILKHHIVDFYRDKARSNIYCFSDLLPKHSEQDYHHLLENILSKQTSDSPDTQIIRSQTSLLIKSAVAQLPEKQALVFRMKALEHIETEQICHLLNITPANYWVLMHRARASLRKYLRVRDVL